MRVDANCHSGRNGLLRWHIHRTTVIELREEMAVVRSLRDHVARLRAVLEDAFGTLAVALPTVSEELAHLSSVLGVRELDESAPALAAAVEALRSVERLVSERRARMLVANRNASELLTALGRRAVGLGGPASGALSLAEGLGAAAFHASASAARAQGKAFVKGESGPSSVVGAGLSLSEHSRRTVPALHQTTGVLQELARRLVNARSEIGDRAERMVSLSGHVGHALDMAAADLTSLRDAIRCAHKCIARSSRFVGAVMVAIQRQDIIRQKLENVLLALMDLETVHAEMELRGEAGPRVALAMQSQVARLCARLIDDVQRDIDGLLDEVSRGLASLAEASQSLTSLRGFAPDVGRLREHIASPVSALRDSQDLVARLGEIVAEHTEASRSLDHLGEDLASNLHSLAEATRSLSGARTVSDLTDLRSNRMLPAPDPQYDIDRMHEEFRALVGVVGDHFTAVKRSSPAMAEIVQRIRSDIDEFKKVESVIAEKTTALRKAALALTDGLERAMMVGGSLGGEAQRFLRALDSVRRASSHGTRALVGCNALMERADEVLAALVPDQASTSDREEVQERLKRLIERFTVLSHKSLGRDVMSVPAESGDAPGTLTIF